MTELEVDESSLVRLINIVGSYDVTYARNRLTGDVVPIAIRRR